MAQDYDDDVKYGIKTGKRIILWLIGLSLFVSAGIFTCNKLTQATHIDDAVIVYEEYQEIYNTCSQLNTDLCRMNEQDEKDKMFEQFSKSQRLLAIKTNLNHWVETYNGKSKMWGRSLWKSSKLPYQLSVQDFPCYNSK